MPLGPNPAQQAVWTDYQKQKLNQLVAASKALMEKDAPKRESKFLDQVQAAVDRRRIFRKRVAALVGGPILTLTAPVLGLDLMRWWQWAGVDKDASGLAGTAVAVGFMGVGVALTVGGIFNSVHKNW